MNPMDRRGFIRTFGAGALLGVSGCLSSGSGDGSGNNGPMRGSNADCVISESTDAVEPVSVTTDGRLRGADVVVDIRWNARTQASVDGAGSYYDTSEGERLVAVRAEISNPGEDAVMIRPLSLGLKPETPNAVMDDYITPMAPGYPDSLDSMSLKAGASVNRLILYEVEDTDVTSGTIEPRPITEMERAFAESNDEELRTTLAFNPTCDESMEINPTPQQ